MMDMNNKLFKNNSDKSLKLVLRWKASVSGKTTPVIIAPGDSLIVSLSHWDVLEMVETDEVRE